MAVSVTLVLEFIPNKTGVVVHAISFLECSIYIVTLNILSYLLCLWCLVEC